jgi:hypothetical protein
MHAAILNIQLSTNIEKPGAIAGHVGNYGKRPATNVVIVITDRFGTRAKLTCERIEPGEARPILYDTQLVLDHETQLDVEFTGGTERLRQHGRFEKAVNHDGVYLHKGLGLAHLVMRLHDVNQRGVCRVCDQVPTNPKGQCPGRAGASVAARAASVAGEDCGS